MTGKAVAREILNALPDDATIDDIIHALYVRAKSERGEQQIREGRGIPHEEARQRHAT